ncbi:MAG: TIGR02285 family protein [Rhodoferax sp.]|nr:TIGR02285 family protein [Rhodoferax sp.]
MKFRVGTLVLLLATLATTQSHAQSVKWVLQDFPPAQMPINGRPGLGFHDEMVRILVANWPEAEHQFVVANSARTWLMLSDKEEACYVGALRNADREKVAYFTPFAVLPPLQLIVRKDTMSKIPVNADGEAMLSELLANPALRGLLVDKRSYGKDIDEIIAQRARKEAIQIVQPGDLGKNLPLMLAANRGDYLLEYDFILNFHKKQNYPQLEELTSLPVAGFSAMLTTNVVCPRSPWGQKTIRRVDAILVKTADSNSIRASVESWLSVDTIKRYRADMNAFAQRRKKPSDPALFN